MATQQTPPRTGQGETNRNLQPISLVDFILLGGGALMIDLFGWISFVLKINALGVQVVPLLGQVLGAGLFAVAMAIPFIASGAWTAVLFIYSMFNHIPMTLSKNVAVGVLAPFKAIPFVGDLIPSNTIITFWILIVENVRRKALSKSSVAGTIVSKVVRRP